MEKIKILFVCMGNICRSPVAEGTFRELVEKEGLFDRVIIDSAGTHAYHVAEPPDLRAQKVTLDRGVDISTLRARRVDPIDFERFDHILAMDQHNYDALIDACPKMFCYKIRYFLDFAPHLKTRNVPDPYYGGDHSFERVLDLIESASLGLVEALRRDELNSF